MARIIQVIPCSVDDVKLKLNVIDVAASHYQEWGVLPNGSTETRQPPPCPAQKGKKGRQKEESAEDGFVHQDLGKTFIATTYIY